MVKRPREKKTGKKNPYILPATVKPRKYSIELHPDFTTFVCHGQETILLTIKKPTKEIKINVHDVVIRTATVKQKNERAAKTITYDKKTQTASIKFNEFLAKGSATLALTFESKIREDLRGFYKSTYELQNGEKRTLLTTQFEATDARSCFPSFDEPLLKATFSITLVIPNNLTAISNMPIKEEQKKRALKRVVFEETPVMPTYLLAFLVGEFESIQKKTSNGVTIGIWTTPGKKEQGTFALDTAAKILKYYENYFNIPYPLPKLDLIAIPDFESGAMENWGAITYREIALLIDEKHSSAASRERVAVVVAHEIAHQWFGNLVTMHWWNDLWLNEGFASWIEYKAVNHLFPEWEMWTQFYTDEQGAAFSLDGLETSHPIDVAVINPAEIDEIFDAVSYSKGASIIHMLEQYLGEDTFRRGLNYYLKKFNYANATTNDLWSSLEHISKKPVKRMMDSWTKQTGYPLVTAKLKEKKVALTQERFFISGPKKDKTCWYIPLAMTQGKKQSYYLLKKRSEVCSPITNNLLMNTNQVGFYRLRYDSSLFQEQLKALQQRQLNILDKIGIIANTFALAEAHYINIKEFLDLLQYYRDETNYTLWAEIAGSLSQLQALFTNHACSKDLDAVTRWTFANILKKKEWEEKAGEQHTDILLRSTVLSMTGFSEEKTVQQEAQQRFRTYLHEKILNPNLRGVVYALAAWTGNEQTWNQLQNLHQETQLQEEKIRLLAAMCMFKQHHLLKKTLEFSLSDAVRSQDSPTGIARVARNPFGTELAWQFFKGNWSEINKRYGAGGHMMGRLIQGMTGNFATQDLATDMKAFFKKHPVPHAKRAIQQSLENISINITFIKKNEQALTTWLTHWKQHHES